MWKTMENLCGSISAHMFRIHWMEQRILELSKSSMLPVQARMLGYQEVIPRKNAKSSFQVCKIKDESKLKSLSRKPSVVYYHIFI